jgi:Na+/alanine symporter
MTKLSFTTTGCWDKAEGFGCASLGLAGICDNTQLQVVTDHRELEALELTGTYAQIIGAVQALEDKTAVKAAVVVFGNVGGAFVSIAISLFAFATIIAWEYQGEKAFEFLVRNSQTCIIYRFVYGLVTFLGAVCSLELVWDFSDIMNGLMAVPNLICILVMSETVRRDVFAHQRTRAIAGNRPKSKSRSQ